MNRVETPYQSSTSGITLTDTDNLYRIREIQTDLDRALLNRYDPTFYRILRSIPRGPELTQVWYTWTEDDILDNHTAINYASGYSASDTSIVVDDSLLAVVNRLFVVQRTEEILKVTAVNYSTHTLTVTRGFLGTAAQALVDDDKIIALTAALPELADANSGTGRIPAGEEYNYVSRFSETFEVSEVQENAAMAENVGQVPWEVANKVFDVNRRINKELIFGKRGKVSTDDGDEFHTQGFVNYIRTNELDLDDHNGTLSWPILNDWLYGLYNHGQSSETKVCHAGNALWSALTRIGRDEKAMVPVGPNQEMQYYNPVVGAMTMAITTDEGGRLDVVQDKHGLTAKEGLGGMGIIYDAAHVMLREYRGETPAWRQEIQDPDAHVRKDEYYGSFSLQLQHEQLHGVIRNAVRNVRDGLH